MTKFRLALAVSILLFVGVSSAQNQVTDRQSAQGALLALEDEWLKAEYDPGPLEHILADDFVHVLPSGFISKTQILDYMRHRRQKPEFGPRHFEHMQVRIYDNTGIATGDVVETAPNGKRIIHRTRFTDVFVFRDNRWQAVNAQELPINEK